MFSYNSFQNGNAIDEEENQNLDTYENTYLPTVSDNAPYLYTASSPAQEEAFDLNPYEVVLFNDMPYEEEYLYAQREPVPREMQPREPIPRQIPRPPTTRAHLSNNPAIPQLLLFKELTGYPNYGNPSGNADILYTGNQGNWTFNISQQMMGMMRTRSGILQISMVLDDHAQTPSQNYAANILFNGVPIHQGTLRLPHGSPSGGRFTNWVVLGLNVRNIRRNNTVQIVNTSRTGRNDWIGIDWMQLMFQMV